jgi:predicted HTH transcriptional regulator
MQINGKDIIVVNVKEGPNKPYYLADKGLKPSGVYLRHGNASVPASEEVIKKLLVENSSNSFESGVSKIQDLNFDYLIRVFKSHDIDIENKSISFFCDISFGDLLYLVKNKEFVSQTNIDFANFSARKKTLPIGGILNDCILSGYLY